jgi:hypothetical protein
MAGAGLEMRHKGKNLAVAAEKCIRAKAGSRGI